MDFKHVSVLLAESVTALVTNHKGIYVDCTLGGSGHSAEICRRLHPEGRLIGIDQDPAAIAAATDRLAFATCQVDIVRGNFQEIGAILEQLDVPEVDGVLFDLGVSSHQLDVAERGFSYMQSAPLDMRMDPASPNSAYQVVNEYREDKLAQIIFQYGEERWAKRIASFIVTARMNKALETTGDLVEVIKKAIPSRARRDGPHPAKRTFQAIRIEVNNELGILEQAFTTAIKRLRQGGRLCIITFHSLEDRIAKQTIQKMAKGCICPPRMPVCICQQRPLVKTVGKAIAPTEDEIKSNPRARSAKLRIAEKLVSGDSE